MTNTPLSLIAIYLPLQPRTDYLHHSRSFPTLLAQSAYVYLSVLNAITPRYGI
jgi:hypothetical protein